MLRLLVMLKDIFGLNRIQECNLLSCVCFVLFCLQVAGCPVTQVLLVFKCHLWARHREPQSTWCPVRFNTMGRPRCHNTWLPPLKTTNMVNAEYVWYLVISSSYKTMWVIKIIKILPNVEFLLSSSNVTAGMSMGSLHLSIHWWPCLNWTVALRYWFEPLCCFLYGAFVSKIKVDWCPAAWPVCFKDCCADDYLFFSSERSQVRIGVCSTVILIVSEINKLLAFTNQLK